MLYSKLICSLLFVSLPLVPMLSSADAVIIEAGADNTLYEDALGSVSNGSGAIMVAGRTRGEVDSIRRAVLFFDVAGAIPHGAVVESVAVNLYLNRGNGGVREMRLHRLLTDWGEGASVKNGGGLGAPAQPGDATWLHTFYPDSFWGGGGGRYVGRVSAMQLVGTPDLEPEKTDIPGTYTWQSTDRLIDDVRRWVRNPEKNYGWILVGDESVEQTAKQFASREDVSLDLRPTLEVTYTLPE
ncbi:MAG: DNRLRE domain-containing protein [Gammaproteobacteria bacterium]